MTARTINPNPNPNCVALIRIDQAFHCSVGFCKPRFRHIVFKGLRTCWRVPRLSRDGLALALALPLFYTTASI